MTRTTKAKAAKTADEKPEKAKNDRCQVQSKTRGRSGQAGKENRRQGKDRGKSKNLRPKQKPNPQSAPAKQKHPRNKDAHTDARTNILIC